MKSPPSTPHPTGTAAGLIIVTRQDPPWPQPESGEWQRSWQGCTRKYVIKDFRSAAGQPAPLIGAKYGDDPFALTVVNTHFKPTDPAYGDLTIECAGGAPVQYEEVEYTMVTTKVEKHSRYASLSADTLLNIENALAFSQAPGTNPYIALFSGIPLAVELFNKRAHGEDSFYEFAPVARRTTFYDVFYLIGPNGTGTIQTPIFFYVPLPPQTYWLKTADRIANRPGYVERVEEWTGGAWIDHDLYTG